MIAGGICPLLILGFWDLGLQGPRDHSYNRNTVTLIAINMTRCSIALQNRVPNALQCFREPPPTFLAPALATALCQQQSSFHTSSAMRTRKKANSPNRGISPMRRTGIRTPLYKLAVGPYVLENGLPKPVDKDKRSKIEVDEEHGLWQFFNDKKLLTDPAEELKHGR